MVVELRSRVLQNDPEVVNASELDRVTEETIGSRLDQIINRTQALEASLADQNKKIDRNIADMLDMIKVMKSNQTSSSGKNGVDRNYSAVSAVSISMTRETVYPSSKAMRGYRSGMNSNSSPGTRLSKLDFHRFSGDRVRKWLFKLEQFFALNFTPEELKVKIASIHFDGATKKWHQSLLDTDFGVKLLSDWKTYKLVLQEHFAEVLDDPIAELKHLKETNGIEEYHKKFELLRAQVNLIEDYLVKAYLDGLQPDTRENVQMFQPQTVNQCFLVGRLYEQAHPLKRDSEMKTEEEKEVAEIEVKTEVETKSSEKRAHEVILKEELITQFQDSPARTAMGFKLEACEIESSNLELVLMEEEPESVNVKGVTLWTQSCNIPDLIQAKMMGTKSLCNNESVYVFEDLSSAILEKNHSQIYCGFDCDACLSGGISRFWKFIGFDIIPGRKVLTKRKKTFYKCRRFKFKQGVIPRTVQSGFEVKMKESSFTEYPCLFLTSKRTTLGHIFLGCGDMTLNLKKKGRFRLFQSCSKTGWFSYIGELYVLHKDVQNFLLACLAIMARETRYSSYFKLAYENIIMAIVYVIGEHDAGHGKKAVYEQIIMASARLLPSLQDLQMFTIGVVLFQIKHKRRFQFQHLVSELGLCLASLALSTSYANLWDCLWMRRSSTLEAEPYSVKVNEMKMEMQIAAKEMSPSIAVMEIGMEEMIGSHAKRAFVFKQTSISYSHCIEHNLLDTMLLRLQRKKNWRFIFKTSSKEYKLHIEIKRWDVNNLVWDPGGSGLQEFDRQAEAIMTLWLWLNSQMWMRLRFFLLGVKKGSGQLYLPKGNVQISTRLPRLSLTCFLGNQKTFWSVKCLCGKVEQPQWSWFIGLMKQLKKRHESTSLLQKKFSSFEPCGQGSSNREI